MKKMTDNCIDNYSSLLEVLNKNADNNYKMFHKKLIYTTKTDNIGVKSPIIKKLAKELSLNFKTALAFPDDWYEVILIKGLVIGYSKADYIEKLQMINNFLPTIDNWAVCDSTVANLKFINKNKTEFLNEIKNYLKSSEEYTVRFALICLLCYYIEDKYIDYILNVILNIKSDYYYINMAAAWLLSVCYIKVEEKTSALIESKQLTPFIQNKGIQKICDSFRVSKDKKEYIKSFKINVGEK
jgi:3-methyladenine DNA glycosylase AlkD